MAKLNLLLLLLVLIACALGLVTFRHKARKLFFDLERDQARARSAVLRVAERTAALFDRNTCNRIEPDAWRS